LTSSLWIGQNNEKAGRTLAGNLYQKLVNNDVFALTASN
jgi:hypothetical protein